MNQKFKDELAEKVMEAHTNFTLGLTNKRSYPRQEFQALFDAVREYAIAIKSDKFIHRSVANEIKGIREYLGLERKRLPGNVLFDADRMECLLFSGYDPSFKGFEPPGC